MKIGVLGAGLMGKEAARNLTESELVTEVGLADLSLSFAASVCEQLEAEKLTAYEVDATDEAALANYMKKFDVVINALFYSFNKSVAETAIKVGTSSVDLGGHIGHITDQVLELHGEAKKAGVTIIPDLGVAPGMINVLSGDGARQLDKVTDIKLYVGGIPLRPEAPLLYNHVFSMEGLLDHYTDPALIIRDGEKREIAALSELEEIHFEKFGPLEAFHTSGGTSTLPLSFPEVETLEYKTIRYPGHAEKFQLLVDLHLTRKDYEVDISGQTVNPREVLLKVLDPIVELGDKQDVVLLRVNVSGEKDGKQQLISYEMVTHKDTNTNVTAMARATAYTISTVAQMIAAGEIKKRGVYPPERIVPGGAYMKAMAARDVFIKMEIN